MLALAWPIILAGCGAYEWRKPGMTEASFRADRGKCEAYVRANYHRARRAYESQIEKRRDTEGIRIFMKYPQRSQVEARLFDECMHKKGYRLVEKKKD